jgi:hypothetical protein
MHHLRGLPSAVPFDLLFNELVRDNRYRCNGPKTERARPDSERRATQSERQGSPYSKDEWLQHRRRATKILVKDMIGLAQLIFAATPPITTAEPTKLMSALRASHVVTPAILLDHEAAVWTPFTLSIDQVLCGLGSSGR